MLFFFFNGELKGNAIRVILERLRPRFIPCFLYLFTILGFYRA